MANDVEILPVINFKSSVTEFRNFVSFYETNFLLRLVASVITELGAYPIPGPWMARHRFIRFVPLTCPY